jgi:hypothetical protein
MIELGKLGKDKITNFEGIITARVQYLYGCDQYCLVPKIDKDGKSIDGQYYDEGRIEIIGDGVLASSVQVSVPGGPNRDAPK